MTNNDTTVDLLIDILKEQVVTNIILSSFGIAIAKGSKDEDLEGLFSDILSTKNEYLQTIISIEKKIAEKLEKAENYKPTFDELYSAMIKNGRI